MTQRLSSRLSRQTIIEYLHAEGKKQEELFSMAKKAKENIFKNRVHFRGIIEFSNFCQNGCFYCGIRNGNRKVQRYKMSMKEIESALDFIAEADYGSVVFQSGEIRNTGWRNYLLDIVRLTRKKYPQLGITVSCGEQSGEFYKKLKKSGADRYLLRIETSSQKLYRKLHPQEMSWKKRFACLKNLQKLGFQVGTGVMVGLPGQTLDDLAEDLMFFKKNKFDMYGIGPYVIHDDTPLATPEATVQWQKNKRSIFNTTLNFLALMRILFPSANIAAATALDVFDPLGRIKALKMSANIIMPVVTPQKYREKYLLYQGKPCIDEDAHECYQCLTRKIRHAGLEPVFGEQGSSPFYLRRMHLPLPIHLLRRDDGQF